MPTLEVSPELRDVAIALGVMKVPGGGSAANATFNDDFFARPDHYLAQVLIEPAQRDAVLRTLAAAAGNTESPMVVAGEQWVPIASAHPGGAVTTGLFLVSKQLGSDVVLSLGAQVERTDGATLRLAARIPLFVIGPSGASFAPGSANGVLAIDATAILHDAPLQIERVVASVHIPTDGHDPSVELRVVRPPEGDPGDIIVNTASPLGEQATRVLHQLLSAIVDDLGPDLGPAVGDLLALLGIGAGRGAIPEFPIEALLSNGRVAVWDWVRSIFSNTTPGSAWMARLATLFGVTVSGAGTLSSPWELCFVTGPVSTCLTVSAAPSAGVLSAVAGVELKVAIPVAIGVPGNARLAVQLVRLNLSAQPSAVFEPELDALVTIGDPNGAADLVTTTVPGVGSIAVRALRTGLRVGTHGPQFVLEAHHVVFGAATPTVFEVLNLTDTDAMLEAGTTLLGDAINAIVTALGNSPAAESIFVLAGLRRPAGTTLATWPQQVTLPQFFANPLDAIRAYHHDVLAAGNWSRLVEQLGAMLRTTAATAAVSGAGTSASPWTVFLATGSTGSFALRASTTDGTDGIRLHLGIALALPRAAITTGVSAGIEVQAELFSVRLAGVGGAAADLDLQALPGIIGALTVGDNVTIDVGPLVLSAHSIHAGVRWAPGSGLAPSLIVDSPTIAVGGTAQPLPLPEWDAVEKRFRFTGTIPWNVLERLAAQLLESVANEAAQILPSLFGWQTYRPSGFPAVPPLAGAPAIGGSKLSLEELCTDPLRALARFCVATLTSPQAREWADVGLGWLGTLAQGLADTTHLQGNGSTDNPWAVPLIGAGRAVEFVASIGEFGGAPGNLGARLLPLGLQRVLDADDPAEVTTDLLTEALQRLAEFDPVVAGMTSRVISPGVSLAALRAVLIGTDGLTSAVAQHGLGNAVATLTGLGTLALPAHFVDGHLPPGAPAASGHIFVRTAIAGTDEWAGHDPARFVDLTGVNLPAESFDLSHLPANGPWFVLLPTRTGTGAVTGASGHLDQVARLQRVVTALATNRGAGAPLALIAHGPAGHVARAVAASATAVTHLTLLGTALSGAPPTWMDAADSGDGLRLVQALRGLSPDAPGQLGEADELLDLLTGLADGRSGTIVGSLASIGPYPIDDIMAPAGIPTLPGTVATTTVAASLDADTIDLGLGRLVGEVVRARSAPASSVGPLRLGVRGSSAPVTAGGIRFQAAFRVDVVELPLDFGDDTSVGASHHPRLCVNLHLDRPTGWLVGGPSGSIPSARRDPRIRSMEAALNVDLIDGSTRLAVTLHDAAALGVSTGRWLFSLSDDPATGLASHLSQEERVLLGEVATALGTRPTSGPLRGLFDLLVSVGLATIDATQHLAFASDPIEQSLLDGRNLLATARTHQSDVVNSIASWFGGAAVGTVVTVPIDANAQLVLDLGDATHPLRVTLSTTGPGLALMGGSTIRGSATVERGGRVELDVHLDSSAGSGSHGRLGLALTVDTAAAVPVRATLERTGGVEGLARLVPLLPTPDTGALLRLVESVAPAEIVRLMAEYMAREVPALRALFDAVSLRVGGRVVLPAALMADPAAWFLSTATLGASDGRVDPARVQSVFAAVRALVPGSHPANAVALPWGLELRCATNGGTLRATVGLSAPMSIASLQLQGSFGLELPTAGAVSPVVALTLDLLDPVTPSTVLGGIDLAVSNTVNAAARIPVGSTILTLPLLPIPGGLGDLAAGARRALPLALDALVTIGVHGGFDVGSAIGALGDALDLRTGATKHFDIVELEALVATPTAFLTRLSAGSNRSDLAAALALFLDPVLPGTAIAVGPKLTLVLSSHVTVEADLTPNVPTVCLIVNDVRPIAGLPIAGEICLGDGGVRKFAVGVDVSSPDLLKIGSTSLFPGASFSIGIDAPRPAGLIEARLWTAAPTAVQRDAILVQLDLATGFALRWRHGGTDTDDPGAAAFGLARAYLIPIAAELIFNITEIRDLLEANLLSTGQKLGQLLHPNVLARTTSGGVHYRLSFLDANPDGSFDPLALLTRALSTAANAASAVLGGSASRGLPLPGGVPLAVNLASETDGSGTRYGITLTIPPHKQIELFSTSSARLSIEVVDDWLSDPAITQPVAGAAGIDVLVVRIPTAGTPSIAPRLIMRGVGLRIDKPGGQKLIDLGLTIRSIGLHGYIDKDFDPGTVVRAGGHLELDQFGIPLGNASGNPVASGFMSPSSSAGDAEKLAPAFSPALAIVSKPSGIGVDVSLRAGPGNGPWWLPIQRAFGPLYVEQVGLGVKRSGSTTESISILVDGGASVAGLTVQVDDLEVIIPWATPFQLNTWRLDLAGIGVGYQGGSLSVAGGLRKLDRNGHPDYLGMLRVTFVPYGITAVGGYGVFEDGAGGEYTSFFLFGAVTAPIGGPPAFFVTGLGGGMGVNRRLISPTIEEVDTFILVQCLDPFSSMAQNPMGALDQLGTVFPPERGAIWFAAGLSFTSFSLVYATAVLTVEVHDGLEINLLGLARIALPNPALPMAQVELALQARLSTQEGIFSIKAQLTENSWLINESCRLTGGFAFVLWFKGDMAGQFVVSLGGYHPDFHKPAAFPSVPRLGISWEPGFGVSIKGGSYFALTATCIMAGVELEASYKSSVVWASLEAGVHVLVSWDPFFYDFKAFIRISAGIDIEICFIVCGHVRLGFSFGAEIHVLGPKLRGSVTLDLDVVSVTVHFGPESATNSPEPLPYVAFRDKYLRSGDDDGHVLTASITRGQVPATVTTSGSGTGQNGVADDGSAAKPWRVGPEFAFSVQTRAATNAIPGLTLPMTITNRHLDLGPAGRANVTSTLSVVVRDPNGVDVSSKFTRTPVLGKAPEATWTVLPSKLAPDAKVIDACTGLDLVAKLDIALDAITVAIERTEISTDVKPIPFAVEGRVSTGRGEFALIRAEALVTQRRVSHAVDVAGNTFTVVARLAAGPLGDTRLTRAAQRTDRVAPPRLVALGTGIADTARRPVRTAVVKAPRVLVPKPDITPNPPTVVAWMRADISQAANTPGPVFTVKSDQPRTVAPTLADIQVGLSASLGAWLRLVAQSSSGRSDAATVLPIGRVPVTAAAGLRRERQRSMRVDPILAKATARIDEDLQGPGALVRAGDAIVFEIARSGHDRATKRPRLRATGELAVRIVTLDRSGRPMTDETLHGDARVSATVPEGAQRLVALGGTQTSLSCGWLSESSLVQVDERSYAGPGCMVIAGSLSTFRGHRTTTTSIMRARDAVRGATSVTTTVAHTTRSIVVLFDGNADDAPSITLAGAKSAGEQLVVQMGERAAIILGITPVGGELPTVVVTDSRELTGVLGSNLSGEATAMLLTLGGVSALCPPAPSVAAATSRLTWSAT